MKNVKWLASLMVAMTLFSISSQAFALGKAPKDLGVRRAKFEKMMVRELNLSPDQGKKFKEHKEGMEKIRLHNRKKSKGLADKLKKEMLLDNPNKKLVYNYVRKIGDLRTAMQVQRLDGIFKLREILTPEQRVKFKEILKNHRPPKHKKWKK